MDSKRRKILIETMDSAKVELDEYGLPKGEYWAQMGKTPWGSEPKKNGTYEPKKAKTKKSKKGKRK